LRTLRTLLAAKGRMTRHQLAQLRQQSRLKVALIVLFTAGLWWGGLRISLGALGWLQLFGDDFLGTTGLRLGGLIAARLLSTLTLTLFLMLVASNLLVHFAALYRARDLPLLLTSPVGWRPLFLARHLEALALSSWGTAFLGSPLLLAFGMTSGAPWSFYPILLLAFLPLAGLAGALGAGITLLTMPFLARWRWRYGLPLIAVVGGGFYGLLRRQFSLLDPGQGASLGTLLAVLEGSERPWLPSQWAVEAVLQGAAGETRQALLWLGALLLAAALALAGTLEIARRRFYPGWAALQDRGSGPSRQGGLFFSLADRLTGPLPEPYRSLTRKDLRTFWRDPAQWSQFLVFFGLMALYVANMQRSSPAYDVEFWQSLITGLNGVVCLLILATLTTRFVFPLISLEGRRIWILGLAPVRWRQILVQKLFLSLASTAFFTLGLAVLSSLRLGLGSRAFAVTLFSIAVATVALSGLAVGLGALFADFQEDSPSRIVSGLGGTLNFILSLLFVLLTAGVQTFLLHSGPLLKWLDWRISQGGLTALGLAVLALLGAVATLLPLRLGLRHLERSEF
jgi:ABC-2 type transport system permease protein